MMQQHRHSLKVLFKKATNTFARLTKPSVKAKKLCLLLPPGNTEKV